MAIIFLILLVTFIIYNVAKRFKKNYKEMRTGLIIGSVYGAFMLVFLTFAVVRFSIPKDWYSEEQVQTYELVSFDSQNASQAELKGSMFLLCGNVSAESEIVRFFEYWYVREDGGILPGRITDDKANVVVYETNEVSPQYVVYSGKRSVPDDSEYKKILKFFSMDSICEEETEYRFYVPVGTFVRNGSYNIE